MPTKRYLRAARLMVAAALCSLSACLFETADTADAKAKPDSTDSLVQAAPKARLEYVVRVTDAAHPKCRVEIRISKWPDAPKIFQAPLYYSDNPALPLPGLSAANVTAEDSMGQALPAVDTALKLGNLDGRFIRLPDDARFLSYDVDLAPKDSITFGIPEPNITEGVQLIDGAYFFILPLVGSDIPTQWRTPLDLSLTFALDPGFRLVGQDTVSGLHTNYELMFVRAALNPPTTATFQLGNHEVTSYNTSRSGMDLQHFNDVLSKCLRVVEDSLLPIPGRHYFVGENTIFWGIEGDQGYWVRSEAAYDPMVQTHEIVHTFVGVLHGEVDDPWWKEGVTEYLGSLLPTQVGLLHDSDFIKQILPRFDTIPSVGKYSLSQVFVRNHLFIPDDSAYHDQVDPDNMIDLVYGKGGQAAMILDRFILEHTEGRASIFNLIKDLIRKHGVAFNRADLTAGVEKYCGTGTQAFLENLLDEVVPLSQDSVRHTYEALKKMGRFLPGNPVGAKSAADNVNRENPEADVIPVAGRKF